MAGKTRVHEVAKELGVESKVVLDWLKNNGEFVKSASSTLEAPVARKLRAALGGATIKPPIEAAKPITPQPLSAPSRASSAAPIGVPPRPARGLLPRPTRRRDGYLTGHGALSSNDDARPPMRYVVDKLTSWEDAADFGRHAGKALLEGKRMLLDCTQTRHVYPNGCVPLAAAVQDFKAEGLEIAFEGEGETGYLGTSALRNPLEAATRNLEHYEVFDRVWVYFDPDEASALARSVVRTLEHRVACEAGVLDALSLCLYEALDNVFEHSGAKCGFFMAQIHQRSAQLTICISDAGIGARASFQGSKYRPATDFDALTLAIQSGVSRTGDKRGNGLYFLQETAQQNGGRLFLKSGEGSLRLERGQASGDNRCRSAFPAGHAGFTIDWQVELSKAVSLKNALGLSMPNLDFESRQDDLGQVVVPIGEHEAGTGSRTAAGQLRAYLTNQLTQGATSVRLDFDGVAVVSASFADEVIGKLAEELGPLRFFQRFQLVNMTPLVEGLLDRAIKLRLSTEPPPAIERPATGRGTSSGPRTRSRTRGGYTSQSQGYES